MMAGKMSIYDFLKEKSPEDLQAEAYRLPDSGDLHLRPGEAWVPGAYEGTVLRTDARIKQHLVTDYHIALAVRKQMLRPSDAHYDTMFRLLAKNAAISIVDPLCSICTALKLVNSAEKKEALRQLSMDLISRSTKREPLKAGIALLGICGSPEDLVFLKPLGIHDEFTLYVAGTAARLLQGKALNAYLRDLAENVHGWGKIAILYELEYSDPEIRSWVVKFGCGNTVGLSYAANVCATKGKLDDILQAMLEGAYDPEESKQYFKGICDIFTGLLKPESRNDGLSDYANAREAAKHFTALCGKYPDLAETDGRAGEIIDGLKFIVG